MINILNNFISEEEAKDILSHIRPSKVQRGKARNTIRRYGSKVPYNASILSKDIPDWLTSITERVAAHINHSIDSITINEYMPSQSIDWHIDSPTSGPVISVLSLQAPAYMGLRKDKVEVTHLLPPSSLLVMTEEHRTEWEHSIQPVQSHRFSIVFRKGTNATK